MDTGGNPVLEQIVLGSRSPRRRQLLESLVGSERVIVCAPSDSDEQGFDDCCSAEAIETRLSAVVHRKRDLVQQQLSQNPPAELCNFGALVVADTAVVVRKPDGSPHVLGQPAVENWASTVRSWFEQYFSGRVHEVWTGYTVQTATQSMDVITRTEVELEELSADMLDWYLSTGESLGKAGGYAIQGHASVFIRGFSGSITNVIGLPLFELARSLQDLGIRGVWCRT
jgi:septum formation protein